MKAMSRSQQLALSEDVATKIQALFWVLVALAITYQADVPAVLDLGPVRLALLDRRQL